jgi:hypothetical protein
MTTKNLKLMSAGILLCCTTGLVAMTAWLTPGRGHSVFWHISLAPGTLLPTDDDQRQTGPEPRGPVRLPRRQDSLGTVEPCRKTRWRTDVHGCTMRLNMFLICSDEAAAKKWLIESGTAQGEEK